MHTEPTVGTCAACGANLEASAFCPACGMPADPVRGVQCPICAETSPTQAAFCMHCGAHLAATTAERRIVTVLFADLSGFTTLTEQLDAEEVHQLIAAWLDPLCEAVLRWGGFVDKFIGDCVMALFGAPVAYENEPERAVRAALDMQAAFDKDAITDRVTAAGISGYRPRLTIGINTGPVVTGMFASGGAWDYTAVGDTVNVAARLQGVCEPGGILVGHTTYQHTSHIFEFGEERVLQVKGRNELVVARSVTGIRAQRGPVRGFEGRSTPFIGRASEVARLREGWRHACSGAPQISLVIGPPGIGKSRLVAELATVEGIAPTDIVRGRSYPYASSTPWEPIAELIRDLHDVGPERSAPEAVNAIVERSSQPWSADERAGLGAVLGSPVADLEQLETLAPEERQERMTAAVGRALKERVEGARLLVLEDLHWADRTTLDFLCTLPELELGGHFLLVLVTRPPLPGETALADLIHALDDRIDIAPLSRTETDKLVDAVLGSHEMPHDLSALIFERSGGNPLFVEEIIKTLTGGDVIVESNGVWRPARDYRDFEIPDSIDSVITTRIDGLDPSAKRVLQYAAIVGRRFWSGVLSDALAHKPVDRELEDLVAGALVRALPESTLAGDREFAFEHLMLQEVAYSGLLRGLRAELHGTVAEWLVERTAADSAEFDDWVAYHFERSQTPERALPYLERAVEAAWNRGALLDAEALLDRAQEIATTREDRARILERSEEVATALGNDARRLEVIEALAKLADAEAEPALAAEAAYRKARRLLDVGELTAARVTGESARAAFETLGSDSRRGDVLSLLGRVAHLWGSYEEALELYRASLALQRRAGDRLGEAETLNRLGLAEVDFGNFTRALDYFDQAQGIYAELNHRPQQSRAVGNRALALRWLGRYEEAEEAAGRAETIAQRCGSRHALLSASLTHALVMAAAGRRAEARERLEEVIRVSPDLRRSTIESRAWLALGEIEDGPAAVDAIERARAVAARSGLVHIEVLGLTRLAQLALEAGDVQAADRHSAESLRLLELHGDIQGPDEVVYFVRSLVLAALGRDGEARAMRETARATVRKTASWIEDPELQRSFLENVTPNPQILADEESP